VACGNQHLYRPWLVIVDAAPAPKSNLAADTFTWRTAFAYRATDSRISGDDLSMRITA